ncbi:MAG: M23 family metallopeptidase [Muribaculaceae bacterium]|nr:M23 family metallopeptidase [Muribaculaceae bacterium]
MKLLKRIIHRGADLGPEDEPGMKIQRFRRLDYVNESAYMRVWSVRLTRRKAILLPVAAVAGIALAVYLLLAFTPLRMLLPSQLHGDIRARYIEATLRLDSLTQVVQRNQLFVDDIEAIMAGNVDPDSARRAHVAMDEKEVADTLMAASEAERAFVQKFESSQRYNLSVLAPIAADGMAFYSPAPGAEAESRADGAGVALRGVSGQGVDAVYRGTVVALFTDSRGLQGVVVQHPNEFVSVYSGLANSFVRRGDKLATGSRIGTASADGSIQFELWHKGVALNPGDYVAF